MRFPLDVGEQIASIMGIGTQLGGSCVRSMARTRVGTRVTSRRPRHNRPKGTHAPPRRGDAGGDRREKADPNQRPKTTPDACGLRRAHRPKRPPSGRGSYACHMSVMKRQHYCGQFRYRPDRPDHVVSDIEPVFAAMPVLRGARVQRPTARSQHPTEQSLQRWIAQGWS